MRNSALRIAKPLSAITVIILKKLVNPAGFLFSIFLIFSYVRQEAVKLFNGESLDGWEGSTSFFRVEENAIIGGSLTQPIDKTYSSIYPSIVFLKK